VTFASCIPSALHVRHCSVIIIIIIIIVIIIKAFDNAPYVDVWTANLGSGQSRDQTENDSRYNLVRSNDRYCPKEGVSCSHVAR